MYTVNEILAMEHVQKKVGTEYLHRTLSGLFEKLPDELDQRIVAMLEHKLGALDVTVDEDKTTIDKPRHHVMIIYDLREDGVHSDTRFVRQEVGHGLDKVIQALPHVQVEKTAYPSKPSLSFLGVADDPVKYHFTWDFRRGIATGFIYQLEGFLRDGPAPSPSEPRNLHIGNFRNWASEGCNAVVLITSGQVQNPQEEAKDLVDIFSRKDNRFGIILTHRGQYNNIPTSIAQYGDLYIPTESGGLTQVIDAYMQFLLKGGAQPHDYLAGRAHEKGG
jgi:hypothetical protein